MLHKTWLIYLACSLQFLITSAKKEGNDSVFHVPFLFLSACQRDYSKSCEWTAQNLGMGSP